MANGGDMVANPMEPALVRKLKIRLLPFLLVLFVLAFIDRMVVASRHSDRTLERRYHLATLSVLAGIAFLLLGVPRSPLFSVVLFSAVAVGNYSFLPIFFSLPGEFLTGSSAAAGIALVTSVTNLGGFAGPFTVGLIRQRTGSFYPGLICAGIFFLVSASLAFVLPKRLSPAGERGEGIDVDLETDPTVLLEKA